MSKRNPRRKDFYTDPARAQRAVALYDGLMQANADERRYQDLSNADLAAELMRLWARTPILTEASNLLDAVASRLQGQLSPTHGAGIAGLAIHLASANADANALAQALEALLDAAWSPEYKAAADRAKAELAEHWLRVRP